mmetsp:Transcript_29882/g.74802  ORF Transcript_29882/g.74802 Transcript_29882/m.74802 type:complete len:245 (+) Transcript_29882:1136-1870(+)
MCEASGAEAAKDEAPQGQGRSTNLSTSQTPRHERWCTRHGDDWRWVLRPRWKPTSTPSFYGSPRRPSQTPTFAHTPSSHPRVPAPAVTGIPTCFSTAETARDRAAAPAVSAATARGTARGATTTRSPATKMSTRVTRFLVQPGQSKCHLGDVFQWTGARGCRLRQTLVVTTTVPGQLPTNSRLPPEMVPPDRLHSMRERRRYEARRRVAAATEQNPPGERGSRRMSTSTIIRKTLPRPSPSKWR